MKPTTLALLIASPFGLLSHLRAAEPLTPPGKPNIVLIFMDDMGYGDIGSFGSVKNRTPNLDRMAREGMKLTSFYAAPVCTASRAQVLTGCYAKRVSLPDVIFPAAPIGLNPDEHTVAELLQSQGYATACIGKWHVGDQPEFLPTRHGFDHYFGLPYSNDMGNDDDKKSKNPPLPLMRDAQVIETISPLAQSELTERYTDEALAFIRQNKSNPFFIYMPHTAVHIPIHPGAKFQGRSSHGTYSDWVEEVDWSVGRMLDTLRELNLAENTLVIFTSDNGPWLGLGEKSGTAGPLRGGKFSTFEGGVREPTLAWWPGKVAANSTCDAVAGNIDLLPTFASIAGASLPTDVKIDGRDLLPLLRGHTRESPREAHFYFKGNRLDAVRSGPWKLTIVPQTEKKTKTTKESKVQAEPEFKPVLYNLETDIGETIDVASQHPDIVGRLQQFITAMEADLGKNEKGPGVRPPGRVKNPSGLYLPGHAPDAAKSAPAR